jgi:outer membrane translocation and assembly module TamA
MIVVLTTLFASGCGYSSYLAKDEVLYTGAEVTVAIAGGTEENDGLQEQMELLIVPEPNAMFLGLFRWKLWLYNVGIFPESLGEPPVLISQMLPDRIAAKMHTQLENKGYFRPDVRYEIKTEESSAELQFAIAVTPAYRISSFTVGGNSALSDTIRSLMEETLIAVGDRYDLDILVLERKRVGTALKEKGYFFFSPDYLIFQADSNAGAGMIGLSLTVSDAIPDDAERSYTIGNITIHSGYSLNQDSLSGAQGDTVQIDGVTFIDLDHEYEPAVIVRSVLLKKGETYNSELHDATLGRLMNLGVYKFVNIRFTASGTAGSPQLEPHIYLTPLPTKNVHFELQGVSKSNNLAGPEFNAGFRNRNTFGGAELFSLTAEIGFEIPMSNERSGGSSFVMGSHGELELPKFLIPWYLDDQTSRFVPKTRIAAGIRLLQRLQYYNMITLESSFGYVWKVSDAAEHVFNPFSITYAQLTSTTEEFKALILLNPLLQKSFEEQFIVGQNYSYQYADQYDLTLKNHVYFKGSIDLSGNVLHLLQSLAYDRAASPAAPYTIFNTAYSLYSKFDIDLRYFINNAAKTSGVAARVIVGVGIPYGNSATLPYVKQFTIGGSNSIRSVAARTLGPGSYYAPENTATAPFLDQAGDIKLEFNTEYRFPIASIFYGALFVDAGNIWLLRRDPARPGGEISGATLFSEIAAGTGIGLRLDLSFFILRLDLATPLRDPSLPSADRWTISRIDFGDPSWRRDNLVLNIALGYPF